jgi:hypothetical protein
MNLADLKRRLRTALIPLCLSVLAACGGGGGGGGVMPSAATPATPAPFAIISQGNGNIELTGTIAGMISGGFTIQGGTGVGYLHVYVTSSTVINGPSPFVGESVDVAGTGSSSTSVTATKVSQLVTATASPSPAPSATPTPAPLSTPTPLTTPTPVASVIGLPSGVSARTGQIAAVMSGKIEIQAGAGCGYMYVQVNSSTTYFNGTPQVGQYGSFTGTGPSCSNSYTAVTVALSSSAPSSTSLSGTVSQATAYGFTLNAAGTSVPVALTSSTAVFGAQLTVGSSVTVTGTGSASSGITATQVAVAAPTPPPVAVATPTPAPISQTHVQIAGYVYGYSGTPTTVPLSSITPWVDWAQTDQTHAPILRSAGIKVDIYTNFWRNYSTDNPIVGYNDLKPGGAHAAAEAKDCSGNSITDPNYGGGYEADPRTSAALGHAQNFISYRLSSFGSNYDAIFTDDAGSVGGITLPCNYDQATYDQAVNSVNTALGYPLWLNALGAFANPASGVDLAQPANVLGLMCEICYSSNAGSNGDFVHTGTFWQNIENAEIAMVSQRKVFWDYARATGDPSIETALRTYVYASFILGYDPQYTMLEEAFRTPSGFPVMPEAGLVPMDPLTTAGSVAGYQQPGGAYMREFAHCYYRGSFVDRCAVVVNSSPAMSAPVPTTSYTHAMSVSGSGVLDGGTIAFNASAPTQLAPGSAVVLFP